jgi:cytochrome c peroxidase
LIDQTKAPNAAKEGIAKSLTEEIGAGRGDWSTPDSSSFIISRDPFRAIRRGRQLFQRKFFRQDGSGPYVRDGSGDIGAVNGIGAGGADSCAACHGRPRGAAGFGGDVATRPDSRDAPHLFGLGLKEMLADEITADLRERRAGAISEARARSKPVTAKLESKGIAFGSITVRPDGSVDAAALEGVDADLRVKPFFHHGGTISIREFVIGALNAEMGFQSWDPEVTEASSKHARVVTPSGMVLDGKLDTIELPPVPDPMNVPSGQGIRNQMATAVVDYLEFYLLNYFKPATYEETAETKHGSALFDRVRCNSCHVRDLQINRDRRVADVETVFDPERGNFNHLFATATPRFVPRDDGSGFPLLKSPSLQPFLVKNIFTDFKRHDLGPDFYERNYDGTIQKQFLTTPLWGVGSTAPYGHDGRSINLHEVILRHGGEAQQSRDFYAILPPREQNALMAFLQTLILFPPDDTASNLDPGDRFAPGYPQVKHGAIKLTVLFNDPTIIE